MSGFTRSYCEQEIFNAAVHLLLRDDLPKLTRLASRVYQDPDAARCIRRLRLLVDGRGATGQQAMKCLAQLEASEDSSEMEGDLICTEKRLQHWLAELQKAAPDPAAPEPEKPSEVISLSFCGPMKRQAEAAEEPEPKRQALEDLPPPAIAVAPPSNSEPPEDFMRNVQDKPIFKNSSHVGVDGFFGTVQHFCSFWPKNIGFFGTVQRFCSPRPRKCCTLQTLVFLLFWDSTAFLLVLA